MQQELHPEQREWGSGSTQHWGELISKPRYDWPVASFQFFSWKLHTRLGSCTAEFPQTSLAQRLPTAHPTLNSASTDCRHSNQRPKQIKERDKESSATTRMFFIFQRLPAINLLEVLLLSSEHFILWDTTGKRRCNANKQWLLCHKSASKSDSCTEGLKSL